MDTRDEAFDFCRRGAFGDDGALLKDRLGMVILSKLDRDPPAEDEEFTEGSDFFLGMVVINIFFEDPFPELPLCPRSP